MLALPPVKNEEPMPLHKYQVGNFVHVGTLKALGTPQGRYEVLRLMPPATDNQNQYRVRSVDSGRERMVKEHDLS
jgi:hypothetical protein